MPFVPTVTPKGLSSVAKVVGVVTASAPAAPIVSAKLATSTSASKPLARARRLDEGVLGELATGRC